MHLKSPQTRFSLRLAIPKVPPRVWGQLIKLQDKNCRFDPFLSTIQFWERLDYLSGTIIYPAVGIFKAALSPVSKQFADRIF